MQVKVLKDQKYLMLEGLVDSVLLVKNCSPIRIGDMKKRYITINDAIEKFPTLKFILGINALN